MPRLLKNHQTIGFLTGHVHNFDRFACIELSVWCICGYRPDVRFPTMGSFGPIKNEDCSFLHQKEVVLDAGISAFIKSGKNSRLRASARNFQVSECAMSTFVDLNARDFSIPRPQVVGLLHLQISGCGIAVFPVPGCRSSAFPSISE